jgi:glutamine synthetase
MSNVQETKLKRGLSVYALTGAGVTKKKIMDFAKEHDVQFVNMQFTDMIGVVKTVTIPIHKLEDAIDSNVWFDGSSVEGFARICESDMYLKPDLSTFAILPWTFDTGTVIARMICDVYTPDGKPFEGDPRNILKKQLARAKKLGYTFYTGPELEFFLFKKENGKLETLPHDNAGYFDQTTDLAAHIRADMSLTLDQMGFEVETLHHEVADGQHEISFKYSDALTTADGAVTFKMVLKAVASKYGLHATFMPKPIAGINGSGMHTNQSLFKNGKNAFFDKNDDYKLSKIAKYFMAGQLEHIRAMNAVVNPIVNSYKRLVPGYEAPIYVTWASTNRSALMRIPRYTEGKEAATRCELRCPDCTANPYLAFAVMLAAGLDGIEKKMKLQDPTEEDVYHFTKDDLDKHEIGSVAPNLRVALTELKNNEVIRGALGEHLFNIYYEAKKDEWKSYIASVSDWEVKRYLETY